MKQLRGSELNFFNKNIQKNIERNRQLVIVLFSVDYQANLGMIFRLCDALNVKKLYLTGSVVSPEGKIFERVSRHKVNNVSWEKSDNINEVLDNLKNDGFEIIGVEITDKSVRYDQYQFGDKVALVLGNEGHGVPDKILAKCDASVFIPMFGSGGSMNVAVASSIVAYKVVLG